MLGRGAPAYKGTYSHLKADFFFQQIRGWEERERERERERDRERDRDRDRDRDRERQTDRQTEGETETERVCVP